MLAVSDVSGLAPWSTDNESSIGDSLSSIALTIFVASPISPSADISVTSTLLSQSAMKSLLQSLFLHCKPIHQCFAVPFFSWFIDIASFTEIIREVMGESTKSEALHDHRGPNVPDIRSIGSFDQRTPDTRRGFYRRRPLLNFLPVWAPFLRRPLSSLSGLMDNAMSSVAIRLCSLRHVICDSERSGVRVHCLQHYAGQNNHPLCGPCRASTESMRELMEVST